MHRLKPATGRFLYGGTILALARKIANANIKTCSKSVIFAVIGKQSLNEGTHICAAHIDSPRLDLKPNPLYEDCEMAYFKTHYYGGIKKYQWTTTPLAIHGVVAKKDGTVVNVTVGEDESDPIFCVTDLLVHLSADQMKKTLAEGVTGENLRVLLGSRPLTDDEGGDRVKFAVMCLMHEKYGITEEDFLSAELTMVPAGRAREVGFDRSLIAAYGHDDRVCAYAAFRPMLTLSAPEKTAVCVLADKEEIGSQGISGMQSDYFETFMGDLCAATGAELRRCFEKSFCLSADVSNAFDPLYAETCDKSNNTKINYGTGIFKYTGARGKSGSSDAAAEVMAYVRRLSPSRTSSGRPASWARSIRAAAARSPAIWQTATSKPWTRAFRFSPCTRRWSWFPSWTPI